MVGRVRGVSLKLSIRVTTRRVHSSYDCCALYHDDCMATAGGSWKKMCRHKVRVSPVKRGQFSSTHKLAPLPVSRRSAEYTSYVYDCSWLVLCANVSLQALGCGHACAVKSYAMNPGR